MSARKRQRVTAPASGPITTAAAMNAANREYWQKHTPSSAPSDPLDVTRAQAQLAVLRETDSAIERSRRVITARQVAPAVDSRRKIGAKSEKRVLDAFNKLRKRDRTRRDLARALSTDPTVGLAEERIYKILGKLGLPI